MAKTPLPTGKNPPLWYTVNDKEKGWTPETGDIKDSTIRDSWNGNKTLMKNSKKPTVSIPKLKVISPIQVGGGSFPEGMILPAQIGGIPCIPGSSLRGAFLNYLLSKWELFSEEEKTFFETLINRENRSWKPKVIRFENLPLNNLSPYPLNAQQDWQIFYKKNRGNDDENDFIGALSVQWQVSPKKEVSKQKPDYQPIIILKNKPTFNQERWIKNSLIEMLKLKGIGRGTAAGFGRLSDIDLPLTTWRIELKGMKPCHQTHTKNERGKYRWSPQVLRATLRGYFTRLALSILDKNKAKQLTSYLFGGLGYPPSPLTLTSYLFDIQKEENIPSKDYSNVTAEEIHSTWIIHVNCSPEFKPLVDDLLNLSSHLGGLGPGWRRPPHPMNKNLFRGSEFTVTMNDNVSVNNNVTSKNYIPANEIQSYLNNLISCLLERIKKLAVTHKIVEQNHQFVTEKREGSIISIWKGGSQKWSDDIVHGICKTSNKNPPSWCGDTKNRPSGYAVREHEEYCLITVFDVQVETALKNKNYRKIY